MQTRSNQAKQFLAFYALTLILGALLFAPSCAKKDSVDADIAKMAGTWKVCAFDGSNDSSQEITVSGTSTTMTVRNFTSSNGSCSGTETLKLVLTGTGSKGAGAAAVGGAFPFDFAVTSSKVTAVDNSALGTVTTCAPAITSPVVGTSYDVTNDACASVAGTTTFTIMKVDTGASPQTLQTGEGTTAADDGSTAEKRNKSLSSTKLLKQ